MPHSNTQSNSATTCNQLWRRGLMVLIAIGISLPPAFAQTSQSNDAKLNGSEYVLNRDHSKILFSISHFYVSSTEGQFTTFDGKLNFEPQAPDLSMVTIHISPGTISTGNTARDDHLRTADFFDVSKFPLATFESTSLVQLSSKTGKIIGSLNLHGVSKPVTLDVTLQTSDLSTDRLIVSAATTLKRSDYGMNNYMGIIGDDVALTIEAEFDRE